MARVGLWYGTTTSNTLDAVDLLRDAFKELDIEMVDYDIADGDLSALSEFDKLIFACPTWDDGELQADWIPGLEKLDEFDLTGKTVALLGLGDQVGYPETFVDALGFIAEVVRKRGGHIVGHWPTEGYDFEESKGLEDGKFLGLVLDIENQSEMNEDRIATWAKQLREAFQQSPRAAV